MQENIITDEIVQNNGYQVLITGITWNKNTVRTYHSKKDDNIELPEQFAYDIPKTVIMQAKKKGNVFNDVIESHVYTFLTRKFGHEVYHCQIWLPLED